MIFLEKLKKKKKKKKKKKISDILNTLVIL